MHIAAGLALSIVWYHQPTTAANVWYPEGPARSVTGGESKTTDAVFTAQDLSGSGDAQAAYC